MKRLNRREFLSATTALGSFAVIASDPEKTAAQTAMKSFKLEEMTVTDLQEAMRSGKLTAHSIAQKYLERIESVDKKINSVIETNPDALKIAADLDK